jgi:hypothetical protein
VGSINAVSNLKFDNIVPHAALFGLILNKETTLAVGSVSSNINFNYLGVRSKTKL